METKELDNDYVAHAYGRFNVTLNNGKGSTISDDNGKQYIDFGSGIGVTAFGICDDEWKAAVETQLDKMQHVSNLYYTEPCARLAKMLCDKTGMKKVFSAIQEQKQTKAQSNLQENIHTTSTARAEARLLRL